MSLKQKLYSIWLLCILGAVAVVPYTRYLGIIPAGVTLPRLILITIAQAAVVYGLLCLGCYLLLQHLDIHPFDRSFQAQADAFSIGCGIGAGLLIVMVNRASAKG